MKSYRVRRVDRVELPESAYVDAVELECRHCLPAEVDGVVEGGAFVLSRTPPVGADIHCPDCRRLSTVPKKTRWVA